MGPISRLRLSAELIKPTWLYARAGSRRDRPERLQRQPAKAADEIGRNAYKPARPTRSEGDDRTDRRPAHVAPLVQRTRRRLLGPDDCDVMSGSKVVGRIFASPTAPDDRPWMWTIIGATVAP